MLRLAILFLFIFAIAIGFAWIADRPGSVTIEWEHFNTIIELTLLNAIIAIAVLVAIIMMAWWVISAVIHSPQSFGRWRAGRRRDKGYEALSRGLVAVSAGNAHLARRLSRESNKLLTNEPLVKMLDAQTALLEGNAEVARQKFEGMLETPDTKLLGLRGLHIEAEKEVNSEAAAHFAREAYAIAPETPWAALGMLKAQGNVGDWSNALKTLETNRTTGMYAKGEYARKRAVVVTALALQQEDENPVAAKTHALAAHKLAPDLVPAAVTAARLCIRFNELRKAGRVLETSWKNEPHPEIAELFINLKTGDSAKDRLKRAEKLSTKQPNHPESHFALANAAIDAGEWERARDSMKIVLDKTPTERACLLMADIEEGANGDTGRVREWLSRALTAPKDAAWTASGIVTDEWAPLSPVTGELDAFRWKVPVEQLGDSKSALDYSQLAPKEMATPEPTPEPTSAKKTKDVPVEIISKQTSTIGATAAAAATAKSSNIKPVTPADQTDTPSILKPEESKSADIIIDADIEDIEVLEVAETVVPKVDTEPDNEKAPEENNNGAKDEPKLSDKPSVHSPYKKSDLDMNEDGLLDIRPDDPGIKEEKPKKRKNFFF